ncbi:aryl-sulfate sulfotransferase [Haloarculaceae archaeon H-GB1-1]|nr:aryl-sulfate sulfotransferase [Haloarculaceae archaeon H-GB1-1]
MVDLPRRRWLLRASLGLVVLALVVAGGLATASHDRVGIGAGTIEEEPTNRTVISVQGYHFQGRANAKKPARLLAVQPDGDVAWRHDSPRKNAWFYDVDPMADGHLLVTSTVPGDTIVYEYDPASDERVWSQRLDAKDTHDVDLLDDGTLLVGNLRNYNETSGVNEDRAYVYDREADEIVWQWQFHERFDPDVGGSYEGDWTHLNDVDAVGDGRFLLSPRNFDQVLLVDRSSKEIVMRLGRDGQFETLHAQHNPDFLRGTNGTPTLLVADSENDRVVEYTRIDGDWERTWTVTGLNWPRDADRLPNGNTLITDTHNQRVVEVTPRGEVVWEFYAPWAPYDAERRGTGDGSNGPTMRQQNVTGTYEVSGGAGIGPSGRQTVADWLIATTEGTVVEDGGRWVAKRWAHLTPWFKPVWIPDWAFAAFVLAGTVTLGWGLGELGLRRRQVWRRVRTVRTAVQTRVRE